MSGPFQALKTGPLELALEGADLRYVRFAGTEIVRRLYPAVRDEAWATPDAVLQAPITSGRDQRIDVRVSGSYHSGAIALDWTAEIEARASGLVRYRLHATALADFSYNRFGLCLLHPLAGVVGRPCRWTTPEGEQEGRLTEAIGPQTVVDGLPQPLIGPFSELEIEMPLGILRCRFEGALFELEDQRNWTDASYKTYGPQLALGFPLHAVKGQHFDQVVEIEPHWIPQASARPPRPTISLGDEVGTLPPIGLVVPPGQSEQPHDTIRLFELSPAHLRVDLAAGDLELLVRAEALARESSAPLEIALRLSDGEPLDDLVDALAALDPAPVRVLLLPAGAGVTPANVEADVVPLLRARLPGVPLVGGTTSHFSALNSAPPELGTLDGVAYGIDPQVHASDEASIMETLEAQGDTVASARALAGGRPVNVGPIALRNPMLGPDPRQASSFCAAWTVGAINALTRAGAASISIFETTGGGSTGDERGRFPVHAALVSLARCTGETALAIDIAEPLAISALALRVDRRTQLLVANSRGATADVSIAPLPPGTARVRDLLTGEPTHYEVEVGDDGTLIVALAAGGLLEVDHEHAAP